VQLPSPESTAASAGQSFRKKITRGIRIYLATPRLRGLLALNLQAGAGAMVIVNTVVQVRGVLGWPDGDAAMVADRCSQPCCYPAGPAADRAVMISAAGLLIAQLVILSTILRGNASQSRWLLLLGLWA
jgi:hypothetical protein